MTEDTPQPIRFFSSTTTTRVNRRADSDPQIQVDHIARFDIDLGAAPNMQPWKGSRIAFCPQWMEAVWQDGRLQTTTVGGPRVQANGSLSEVSQSRKCWRGTGRRDILPDVLSKSLESYAADIAIEESGGRR